MTIFQTLRRTALAFAILAPASAQAATVTVTDLGALPGNAVANPAPVQIGTTGTPPNGANASYGNVFGSQTGTNNRTVAADPWSGTSLAGQAPYSSVSGNAFAVFAFGTLQASLSLIWGTPDTYNDLHFLRGSDIVATVNGSVIRALPGPSTKWLEFTGVRFDGLKFTSGSINAFEFANTQTSPVPLPAAGWMLIAGLGALGAAARRRRAA